MSLVSGRKIVSTYEAFLDVLDQAEKLARRAVELEPNHARYYLLSAACIKNRHLQEALKAINQALTITPDDAKYRKLRNQLEKAMAQKRNP